MGGRQTRYYWLLLQELMLLIQQLILHLLTLFQLHLLLLVLVLLEGGWECYPSPSAQ
jgi:hypothetical protein